MHPTQDRERTSPAVATLPKQAPILLSAHASAGLRPTGALAPDPASLAGFTATALPSYGSTPDGAAALEIIRAGQESGLDESGQRKLMGRLQADIDRIAEGIQEEGIRIGHPLDGPRAYVLACEQWLLRRSMIPDYTLDIDDYMDARGRC